MAVSNPRGAWGEEELNAWRLRDHRGAMVSTVMFFENSWEWWTDHTGWSVHAPCVCRYAAMMAAERALSGGGVGYALAEG